MSKRGYRNIGYRNIGYRNIGESEIGYRNRYIKCNIFSIVITLVMVSMAIELLAYNAEGGYIEPTDEHCGCHDNVVAPFVLTHSNITSKYGEWSVKCFTCHSIHHEDLSNINGNENYIFNGLSTNVTETTLSKTGAGWTIDQYKGYVLIPNTNINSSMYKIKGNTIDTLSIEGSINLKESKTGNTFAIIYRKMIRTNITTPNNGTKNVKFFSPEGIHSFADGDTTYDGICEVCHSKTNHFRNNGNAPDQSHTNMGAVVGKKCTNCHQHTNGFKGMGGGAHDAHITASYGPKISCEDCHGIQPPPLLADGQNLQNTSVCDTCHSPNGSYDGVNDMNIGAKNNWVGAHNSTGSNGSDNTLKAGKEKWCIGCHDNSPSVVNGKTAPNKAGDNGTYGYYVTGHGRVSNYVRMSWQDLSGNGNPGANKSCSDCHNINSEHIMQGTNTSYRLKSGYENDQNNTNCNNCHRPGGSAIANPQFYTNSSDYENSAHGGKNCTECHDAHGSVGPYKAMTIGEKQNLCYQCHKDPMSGGIRNDAISNNRPGGYNSSNDIQEAFAKPEKHDLGTQFTINNKNYNLECTSCHNLHIVTGKYWDAESGKSPITRFTNNTALWGDNIGEKMNDFASKASGSGGWYYSVARGREIQFDKRAVYQPPLSGSGYNYEFSGDALPDYATFCLDCHSYRMSDANPPVNWGQGIPCTGNSVDLPNQRVECGTQHGLGSANKPSYTIDPGLLGSGGNPDPIFNVSGVTRGRGIGHFMRWPYETVQRIAGVNFVMSCTDCHEVHGSSISSMIRERFNVNEQGACGTGTYGQNCGTTIWNSYCNVCHYYYGGQHDGMSCSTASCHEAQSLHRIIHNTESGGTYLWAEPSRPVNTPEIENVLATINNNELIVTFSQGVYTNKNNTGALVPNDFVLVDVNGNNPRMITNVIHTPGSSTAILITSSPTMSTDMLNDTVATAGISIWNGSNPAGPWPIKIGMNVVTFQMNEVSGSNIAKDESGIFKGTVNNSSGSFIGDGYFHGDGISNYIDFENYDTSFKASTELTIETRVRPIGLDGTSTYIRRIFARDGGGNYQLSIWRNNSVFPGYNAPSGTSSIAFWVNPVDKHGGVAWKPVLTDYNSYPIVSDHWYKIKVVWNSYKIGGIPADIFVDDQGIDGNGFGENWQGYANATDSDQSQLPTDRWLFQGDKIFMSDGDFVIGSNINNHNNNVFNGLIDWIIWKGYSDYNT